MPAGRSLKLLLAATCCTLCFVWFTSQSLPEMMGSHFGASGEADGFMKRQHYTWFMMVAVVMLGSILGLAPVLQMPRWGDSAKLSVGDALRLQRAEATVTVLKEMMPLAGTQLVLFLGYTHWLVVSANRTVRPRLDGEVFIGGLAVYACCMLVWGVLFTARLVRLRSYVTGANCG